MTSKTRTITLTNRPPVKIREDDWPEIAHGQYKDFNNQYEFQASRTWQADMRVRQHADGRAIVYGVYDYDTAHQGAKGFVARAGVLIDAGDDTVAAINEVGDTLKAAALDGGHEDFVAHISAAVRDCIADLPAQEL